MWIIIRRNFADLYYFGSNFKYESEIISRRYLISTLNMFFLCSRWPVSFGTGSQGRWRGHLQEFFVQRLDPSHQESLLAAAALRQWRKYSQTTQNLQKSRWAEKNSSFTIPLFSENVTALKSLSYDTHFFFAKSLKSLLLSKYDTSLLRKRNHVKVSFIRYTFFCEIR